ncbi:MAG TPA: class I SAM-dependent methyltransferase [Kofleriaceae bacterium]|nr:class I SAM-dependent methyltransferase [Kofleriaceae bacterium]
MNFHDEVKKRLETHHGGATFADTMAKGFASRFNDDFWALWQRDVVAHQAATPTYVDLGCGPGLLLRAWKERYPAARVLGVDVQPYMLEAARTVATDVGGEIVECDLHALALPLPDNSVDGIVLSMVIHEMHEPVGLLREAHRVLRGRMVISDWVRSPLQTYLQRWPLEESLQLSSPAEKRAHHFDHFMEHCKYTAADVTWLVQELGFVIESATERQNGQFLTLVVRK